MRALLDTQAFLYSVAGPGPPPRHTLTIIEDLENDLYLSIASVWEMAIKLSIGKPSLARPLAALVTTQLATTRIFLLPINIEHTAAVATLPLHHRDPFDRMLVAQSTVERLPIVSGDGAFELYGVERL